MPAPREAADGAPGPLPPGRPAGAHLVERAAERLRLIAAGHAAGPATGPATGLAPAADPAGERPPLTPPVAAPLASALAATPHFVEVSLLAAAGMLDGARERRRICEEFRLIEGQLLRQAFDAMSGPDGEPGPPAGNLMMVTSAREGEGKSFTALNLATGIARQRDRDVLLIDADAKVASLGERLGLAKLPGLLDLAADPALVADRLLVPTGLERLHILPIGQRIDGAAEAFGARQMARRLRELASAMPDRLVIIDTPPCLLSSAASALASLVGQCVLVVQAERTAPREVEAAADLLQSCPAVLLLLNQVRLSNRHGFGAGPYGRYDRDA